MNCFKIKSLFLMVMAVALILGLQSCGGGRKYLVIPHSVSTISPVSINDLDLKPGDYEILKTVTESASVFCEYKDKKILVAGGDGDFYFNFELTPSGWILKSFSGAVDQGYFESDYESVPVVVPNPEEFARRAAIARIINMARDYGADAVVEPICVTRASNNGKNRVEYAASVSAKLVQIKAK